MPNKAGLASDRSTPAIKGGPPPPILSHGPLNARRDHSSNTHPSRKQLLSSQELHLPTFISADRGRSQSDFFFNPGTKNRENYTENMYTARIREYMRPHKQDPKPAHAAY